MYTENFPWLAKYVLKVDNEMHFKGHSAKNRDLSHDQISNCGNKLRRILFLGHLTMLTLLHRMDWGRWLWILTG